MDSCLHGTTHRGPLLIWWLLCPLWALHGEAYSILQYLCWCYLVSHLLLCSALNSSAPNLLNNFCSPGMAKDTCGVSTAFITIFCLGCQIFCSKTFTVIHFDLVGTKEPNMCIHSEFVFFLFHFPSMLVICHSCSFGCATTWILFAHFSWVSASKNNVANSLSQANGQDVSYRDKCLHMSLQHGVQHKHKI